MVDVDLVVFNSCCGRSIPIIFFPGVIFFDAKLYLIILYDCIFKPFYLNKLNKIIKQIINNI